MVLLWTFMCQVLIIATAHGEPHTCLRYSSEFESVPGKVIEKLASKTSYLNARLMIKKRLPTKWPFGTYLCEPLYFFHINRHSIRNPSEEWINQLATVLRPLQSHLINSGKTPKRIKKQLKEWKFRFSPDDGNHLTLTGYWQTAEIAKMYYQLFPKLLNSEKSQFEVGVSSKIYTAETADAYINSLIEEQLKSSAVHISDKAEATNFFKESKFPKHYVSSLMSYEVCKKVFIKNCPLLVQFKKSTGMNNLIQTISQRFGNYTLTIKDVEVAYSACKFETVIFGHSVWCEVFNEDDFKALNYINDLKNYYLAYNSTMYREIACTVYSDMAQKFQSHIDNGHKEAKSTLYFCNENLFRKMLAYFGLYSFLPAYQEKNDRLCIPEHRDWQSSDLLPFNANLAHILYKCPRGVHKMLTLHNENPTRLPGCDSAFCDFRKFLRHFKSSFDDCDVNKICSTT